MAEAKALAGGEKRGPLKIASLAGLEDRELNELFRLAEIRRLKRGEYLIREGETDQTAFVILDGVIGVYKEIRGETVEIAVLGEGDWVGEIAFTHRIRRTASALAKTPTSVLAVDQNTLDALGHATQLFFYRKLNDLAARRVAELSERETELAGQNLQLVDYIASARQRERGDYGSSAMIRAIVAKAPRLPAFAADMTLKLLDEGVAPAEAAEMVKTDTALAQLVFQTVNSPYYGFPKKVSDVHQAIMLLGYHEIFQLVLAEGVRRVMPDTPAFRDLHRHSSIVGHLAFAIAQESGKGMPTQAAAVGLLHDVGLSVVQLLKERNPKLAMLIEILDHAQLGSLLLREWGLPDDVARAIEFQYHPEFSPPERIPEAVRLNVAVLYLAHLAQDYLSGRAETETPRTFLNAYCSLLGWSGLSIKDVVQTKLRPTLIKKANTYPAGFRKLLVPAAAGKP